MRQILKLNLSKQVRKNSCLVNPLSSNFSTKQDNSTIIVGAGLGGLICGAMLSKSGVPVTLIERQSIPGGITLSTLF